MNTEVTNLELILILFASILTVLVVLLIVGNWLNFHLAACCHSLTRHRKCSFITSTRKESIQESTPTFIDLIPFNEPLNNNNNDNNNNNSLWMPANGSISSLITNETTFDDTSMPNSTSAYDIVSYANNIKPALQRTISCDFDDESVIMSLNDLYMTDRDTGRGKLQITINYNALEEYLEILFIQVRDVKVSNKDNNDDLKLFILSWLDNERKIFQRTQFVTYQENQTILFNSSMKWKIDDHRLPRTVLNIYLYIRHKTNTENIIGEYSFTIGEIYIYQPLTTWFNLHNRDEAFWCRGEISISLCYHPTADRLTCSLMQARNLIFHRQESFTTDIISTDCYATISLLHHRQVIKKMRTSIHHASDRNPVFNETSVFNVSSNDLLTSYLRIVIYEIISSSSSSSTTTTTTKTVEIGHCLIGDHDRSHYSSHWQQMLRVLRRPVMIWHPLKL